MKNENKQYLERVKEEILEYYNGKTDDDGNELGLYDYISTQVLDNRYIIEGNLEYRSCELFITLGGPTVWIETESKTLQIRWGGEKDELYLGSDVCDELDRIYEEFYICR